MKQLLPSTQIKLLPLKVFYPLYPPLGFFLRIEKLYYIGIFIQTVFRSAGSNCLQTKVTHVPLLQKNKRSSGRA
jgi:hypothetical protein